MRQARQASAGPSSRRGVASSSRRKPPHRASNSDTPIIDLTDSEDEQPRKRQRVASYVDLTEFEAPPSRSVGRAAPAELRNDVGPAYPKGNVVEVQGRHELGHRDPHMQVGNVDRNYGASDIAPAGDEMRNNMKDHYLTQVLEVVPDVLPEYALGLVGTSIESHGSDAVNNVVHMLLENSSYPKIEKISKKRKRVEDDDSTPASNVTADVDYARVDRVFQGGTYYVDMALDQLTVDFPRIPKPYIRKIQALCNYLYAPAYFRLRDDSKSARLPYKPKVTTTKPQAKMKYYDPEFDREREWLLQKLSSEAGPSTQPAIEDGIECGCCFSDYPFDQMVQCPDAHLFCISCMTSYVSDRLGQHDPQIKCMDQSGCKLLFSDSELKRFLPGKLQSLYERVKQTKEIEAAGLDGLEDCPFCDFKIVIENEEEKLFRCQNEDCGVVSCRACKKVDHLPKSCKEAEEEKGLDARHRVEEAMTEAIMRKCPQCRKPFIKELGCNKMTCPHCHTLSCYVCRKVIKGYDHFNEDPSGRRSSSSSKKCALWDKVEERHEQEAAVARHRAIEEARKENPELDKKDLEVELPKVAPPANGLQPAHGVHRHPRHHHHHRNPGLVALNRGPPLPPYLPVHRPRIVELPPPLQPVHIDNQLEAIRHHAQYPIPAQHHMRYPGQQDLQFIMPPQFHPRLVHDGNRIAADIQRPPPPPPMPALHYQHAWRADMLN